MKYRILQKSENDFRIEYKYKYWPFWCSHGGMVGGPDGMHCYYGYKSEVDALAEISRLKYEKSLQWKVVCEVGETQGGKG